MELNLEPRANRDGPDRSKRVQILASEQLIDRQAL